MKQIHINRLLKLAKHLRTGTLAHVHFDFGTYNSGGERDARNCGTNGCGMGEAPEVWPGLWAWAPYGDPGVFLKRKSSGTVHKDGEKFFGLSNPEYENLFLPHRGFYTLPKGRLTADATKDQVAENIEKFCERKQWLIDATEKVAARFKSQIPCV